MHRFIDSLYAFFASLKLTVWLLAASLFLVFFGTLDQMNVGIREAQAIYFESLVAFWHYDPSWPGGNVLGWLVIPMPGGYLVGPLLLINLLCAHFRHFRLKLTALGNSVIHGGIVLMLLGQFYAQMFQEESYLWIDEGGTKNYAESFRRDELVIIDKSNPSGDRVVSIPAESLADGKSLQFPELPFRVNVVRFMPNARLQSLPPGAPRAETGITRGLGAQMNLTIEQLPRSTSDNQRNLTTAIVEIAGADGPIGTWVVANVFDDQFPPQQFTYDGRVFELSLRFKRTYLPYTLELVDFKHERYEGTSIPKSFSSEVIIHDPRNDEERHALISMNNPLRYDGLTFFQASFDKADTASMFHVVRNAGWLIPYISCILVSIGLAIQFCIGLYKFRKAKA